MSTDFFYDSPAKARRFHTAQGDTAAHGTVRYNELKRSVRGITSMMSTKCLKKMELAGMGARLQSGKSRRYKEIERLRGEFTHGNNRSGNPVG